MKKAALLYSGGLDSLCAHRYLLEKGADHDLVYIPCGTETSNYEIDKMIENEFDLGTPIQYMMPTINISEFEQSNGFVPLRNLLFLAMPVMAGYDTVYIGAVKGEGSLDKSHRFFKDTSDLFSYLLEKKVSVSSPIDHLTKTGLVKKILALKLATVSDLRRTTSCYAPQDTTTGRCGQCNACVRRWAAMINNNIYEYYDVDPAIQASRLWINTPAKKLFTQPMGRWPDVILTNIELRDALKTVGR